MSTTIQMTDAQKIWDILMADIKNDVGVAALMGNLFAESSLNPRKKTGKISAMTANYPHDINKEVFSHDGVAYGLAQWRYWSRKQAMWEFIVSGRGKKLDDLESQVYFLLYELRTYKTVWKTLCESKNLQECSDIVLEKYEKPAGTGTSVKAKRASYGAAYLAACSHSDIVDKDKNEDKDETPVVEMKAKYIVTTADNVIVRAGNGKQFSNMGKILKKDSIRKWIATAENGWHAFVTLKGDKVCWISPDYSKIEERVTDVTL